MYNIKLYIIKIVVVVTILQFGSLFINTVSYKQLYAIMGGIVLMGTIFSVPDINVDFSGFEYAGDTSTVKFDELLNEEFEVSVEQLVKNDLQKYFNLNASVNVDTIDDSLVIQIIYDSEYIASKEIHDYIRNNYCTENDRVVVENEKNI